MSFDPTQFAQPTFTQVANNRVEMQLSLQNNIVPEARTFADTFDFTRTGWLFIGDINFRRTIFQSSREVQVELFSIDERAFPFTDATLTSVTVDGELLDPSMYTLTPETPTVDTGLVYQTISSDALRDATDLVTVHYSVSTSAEGVLPIDVILDFEVYTPVYSGVTSNDSAAVSLGVDPRWQVTWSGTANTFTPAMGVSEQLTIGLQEDATAGNFNSGSSSPVRTTIQRNSLIIPQTLGTVGDTVFYNSSLRFSSADLVSARRSDSAALVVEVGSQTSPRPGGGFRFPITNPFSGAQSVREAIDNIIDNGPYSYTNDNSATFDVTFARNEVDTCLLYTSPSPRDS